MGACISQCVFGFIRNRDPAMTKPDNGVCAYIVNMDLVPECAICLDAMKSGDNVSLLPCGHIFHTRCAFAWFHRRRVCPYCETHVEI
jgi:hypothetical protein